MLRLTLLLTLLPTLALADVSGPARVIDGNTIEVAGERVSDRRRLARAILDPVSP